MMEKMKDIRSLMLGDVGKARKALQVLDGDIVFSPVMREVTKTLAGKIQAGALLAPAFAVQLSMVPGAGPDNHTRMRPQGNTR